MLNFRTDQGGIYIQLQLALLAAFLIATVTFFLLDKEERYPAAGLAPFVIASSIFLLVGFSSGLARGQPLREIVSISLPTAIYIVTGYATCRIVMTLDPRRIRNALALLCGGYVVAGVAMYRLVSGPVDFSTVRFQILSGATIPALGYIECLVLFGLTLFEAAAFAGGVLLVVLSVTRTYLVGMVVQFAPLLAGWRKLLLPRLPLVAGIGSLMLALLVLFGGDEVDRWSHRLFDQQTASGEDYTYYTRQSEWEFMFNAFTHGGRTIMFGNGIAAHTVWYNPREIGGGVAAGSIGFGHGQHIALLFIGGIVGGGILLLVQFIQAIQSVFLLARLSLRRDRSSSLLFLAAWGATIILGFVAANFLSSALGNRSSAAWYGIGTGLLIGARARYRRDSVVSVPVARLAGPTAALFRRARSGLRVPAAVARRRRALLPQEPSA